jgi:hypothetical protein
MLNHPDADRALLGKGPWPVVALEPQGIDGIPCRREVARRVKQHQIDDALPGTPRHRGTADVLDLSHGQPPFD